MGFVLRDHEGFAYRGPRLSRGPDTTWHPKMTLPRKGKDKVS